MACDVDMTVAMAGIDRAAKTTETHFFVLTRNLSTNCRRGRTECPANAIALSPLTKDCVQHCGARLRYSATIGIAWVVRGRGKTRSDGGLAQAVREIFAIF